MKTKARTLTRTTRPSRPPVPVRRPPAAPPPAVSRAMLVQPKLTVGAVSDPAEREAETMAARVVGASAPVTAPPPAAPQGARAAQPLRRSAEGQPNLDELVPEPAPAEQQDFELPAENDVSTDGLNAEDMGELESGTPTDLGGEELQASAAPSAVVGRMGGAAPADVSALVANPGPGRPLPAGLRARVEPHFETSFEDVRLHDGPADQDAAARIGARAFTHKNRIWLGRGESPTNTRLMAHELSHVVQQTQGSEALPLRREPVIHREEAEPEAGGLGSGAIEALARYAPGYTLITVIMGRTLFSGKRVLKTAENLLGGLFGLHPLGTVLFDKLRETRMVEEAFQWVQSRLGELNLTWSRLKGVISRVFNPPLIGAKKYVMDQFVPLVSDIKTFVIDVGKKVLEFAVRGALKIAGPYADKVWAIIQQAGDVLHLIVEDPLTFAKNLIKAVVGGFMKFGANILEHLKKGLLGWLFGAIAGAGITLPAKFDFKGIMSLVMQILGLTYANFRAELVKKLGPSGERKVALIEKSVEIIKVLLKEGFAGIWRKILEMIENFKSTLIGGLSSMVITTVIKAGISWLAGLSNPVGAVVKVVLGIYDLIVAFLERLEQIMAVAQSIFSSVGAIARGQTEAAANFVEQTIGRTVPVVISFLAAALGLGGISSKIKGVIEKLQAPVKKAMGKLIGFVIKKAKALFSKLIGKLNGKRKLIKVPFKIGKTPHELIAAKDGKKVKYLIASGDPKEKGIRKTATNKATNDITQPDLRKKVEPINTKVAALDAGMEPHENIDTTQQKENTRKRVEASQETATKVSGDLTAAAAPIAEDPQIETNLPPQDDALYRVGTGRIPELEGFWGTYTQAAAEKDTLTTGLGNDEKNKYEIDHIIEKQYPIHILNNLDQLGQRPPTNGRTYRSRPRGATGNPLTVHGNATPQAGAFGRLGNQITSIAPNGGVLPAIVTYKISHQRETGGQDFGSAQTLVRNALQDRNPRRYLRERLQDQLNREIDAAHLTARGDVDMPGATRQRIYDSLEKLKIENGLIYRLGTQDTTPPMGPAERVDPRRYMDGREGGPAYVEQEGSGAIYGGLQGYAGYVENDHILERGHVTAAKSLSLLTPGQAESLRAYLRGSASELALNAQQNARLTAVVNADMFHSSSPIGSYDARGSTGYAIPLEKGLADRVSDLNRGRGISFEPQELGQKTLGQLAQFIKNGNTSAYKKAARTLQSPVRRALSASTDFHASTVEAQYAAEHPNVTAANPGNEEAALQDFRRIQQNVRRSLSRAKTETTLLFGNPVPPV